MEVLLGGVAGLVTGLLGSLVAGVFQITAKRMRNARYVRRDEPPAKDIVFTPFWALFGVLGLISGLSWTWRLDGTWLTGAIAGLGMPALACVVFLCWGLAQLRR